jgi:hypothetical protein
MRKKTDSACAADSGDFKTVSGPLARKATGGGSLAWRGVAFIREMYHVKSKSAIHPI